MPTEPCAPPEPLTLEALEHELEQRFPPEQWYRLLVRQAARTELLANEFLALRERVRVLEERAA